MEVTPLIRELINNRGLNYQLPDNYQLEDVHKLMHKHGYIITIVPLYINSGIGNYEFEPTWYILDEGQDETQPCLYYKSITYLSDDHANEVPLKDAIAWALMIMHYKLLGTTNKIFPHNMAG